MWGGQPRRINPSDRTLGGFAGSLSHVFDYLILSFRSRDSQVSSLECASLSVASNRPGSDMLQPSDAIFRGSHTHLIHERLSRLRHQ